MSESGRAAAQADFSFDAADRHLLRKTALRSIEQGLTHGEPLRVDVDAAPAPLRALRASFTTLRRAGALRGCIGSLEATRPLLEDVARSAYKAAFEDPRFSPIVAEELHGLEIHVAVLGPLEPIEVPSREALLAALRPGVDGLLLEDGPHHATFLPAVWESLRTPEAFLGELAKKAGLPADHWSANLKVWRYRVESID